MRILFLTSPEQDILSDSVLHGLRLLLGERCVDFPRKDVLYRNYEPPPKSSPYGHLFTLWRTLEDVAVDREDLDAKAKAGHFDLVVVGSIHRSLNAFRHFASLVRRTSIIVLDGEDSRAVVKEAVRRHPYYKRELCRLTALWTYDSQGKRQRFAIPMPTIVLGLRETSFSIPAEKVCHSPTPAARRTKLMPEHIVDSELRELLRRSKGDARGYVHKSETAYYSDLSSALFGITTKRAGWDCLRHYELAANGGILCFRNFQQKPPRCAPHGLSPRNVIAYRSAEDLLRQVTRLSTTECDGLIEASHQWALRSTTERRAAEWLGSVREF